MGKRKPVPRTSLVKISELQLLAVLVVLLWFMSSLPRLPDIFSHVVRPFGGKHFAQQVLSYSTIQDAIEATASATPVIPTIPDTEYCLQVPVLMYHHIQPQDIAVEDDQEGLTVSPEYFAMQMQYLAANGYHSIAAEDLVKALISGTSLPDKPVVVTADDGYQDIYDYALPILKKYHITASLMIPTGLIGKHIATNTYLTWKELKEMKKSGLVYAYSHTVTHAALGIISSTDARRELTDSQQTLTEELGYTYPLLTYPYGSYSDSAISLEKDLGFVAGFTTDPGDMECRSMLMKLPRVRIGNAPLSAYGF